VLEDETVAAFDAGRLIRLKPPCVLDRRHLLGSGLALVSRRLEPKEALAFLALLLLGF